MGGAEPTGGQYGGRPQLGHRLLVIMVSFFPLEFRAVQKRGSVPGLVPNTEPFSFIPDVLELQLLLVHLEACHALQHLGADLVVAVTAPHHATHEQGGTNQQLNYATVDEGQHILRAENIQDNGDTAG